MADIRCPMCSKTNPSEAELCRFCGARLVPLAPSSQPPPAGQNDSGGDVEDWLSSLRSGASPFESTGEGSRDEAEASRQSEEFPDWLSRIQPAEQPAEEALPAASDTLSDALFSSPADAIGGESLPEWLADLSSLAATSAAAEEQPSPEAELPPAPTEAEPASLDWLSSLAATSAAEEQPSPEAELPPTPTEAEPASLDWLSSISHEESQPSKPDLTSQTDFPDWLNELGQKPTQPGNEIPVWGAEPSSSLAEDLSIEPEAQPAEMLPDWLKAMPRPAGEALPEIPSESDLAWLSQFASEVQSAPTESSVPPTIIEPPAPQQMAAAEEISAAAQPALELPQSTPSSAEPEAVSEAPLPTPSEPELPDWLSEFKKTGTPAVEPAFDESIAEQAVTAEEPSSAFAEPASDLPEWLRKIKTSAADQSSLISVPPLLSVESTPLQGETMPGDVTQLGGDLPDWLTHPEQAGQAEGDLSAELAPAELPNWVEAMRPAQAGAAGSLAIDEVDNRVEKSGPLAGLQGVLPIQGMPAAPAKARVYGSDLHLSDRQRQNLNLLQEVMAEETRPFPVLTRRGDAPRMLFRLLISLMLILAFVLWTVSGFEFTSPPAASPQMQTLFQRIDRLTPGAPVLLAVEYEGGLSGEMRLASLSLVRHLMEKNLRLVSLSTLPVGPALAADLVQLAQIGVNYSLAEQFTNLGYLAGGSTSLAELANSPLPRVFPTALDGKPFQAQKALQGISQLRDFSAVLILTDSPDTARAWIEQVQTPMQRNAGGIRQPFYVISSAQAAPLVLPYLDSGQVQGLVAGLAGSAAYEAAAQRSGPASLFWGAYQLGVIFSILILLAGGLIQAAASLSRRPGKRG